MESELSDRELDALVAERVMGWREVVVNKIDDDWITVYGCKPDWMSFPAFWELQGAIDKGQGGEEKRHVPCYSTNVACAFQVLNRLSDGPWSIVHSDHPSASAVPYAVNLGRHEGRYSSRVKKYSAEAATLPRAICLAALAATESTLKSTSSVSA